MSSRILLVEDNADLAYGLRNNLEIEGYQVDVAGDGQTGLDRARATHPDLLVLDLMLPAMDGFRVLKALRDDGARFPILILTARGEESDKVQGLKLGADDYVTKPFGVLELMAFLEDTFHITIDSSRHELHEFDTIEKIVALVERCRPA